MHLVDFWVLCNVEYLSGFVEVISKWRHSHRSELNVHCMCQLHAWRLICEISNHLRAHKPVFHLATLFARREAKTRIRHRDWLKLAGEKIRCEQIGTVPTFLSVRVNKFAKWKTGLMSHNREYI